LRKGTTPDSLLVNNSVSINQWSVHCGHNTWFSSFHSGWNRFPGAAMHSSQ